MNVNYYVMHFFYLIAKTFFTVKEIIWLPKSTIRTVTGIGFKKLPPL